MTDHGVIILNRVAAENVDSWNRSFRSPSAMDNGYVMHLDSLSSASDSSQLEVWQATEPGTLTLTDLWMNASPEIVDVTSGNSTYRGLNVDPRNFYLSASSIGDAFYCKRGDIITLTGDAITSTVNDYVNVTTSFKLGFGASQTGSALSFKRIETTYISIGSGAIDNQRVTAYRLLCLFN